MPSGRSIIRCLCLLFAFLIPAAQAAKDDRDPIVVQDPHYGEVLFYFYQEDYFPAIVRLLAGQAAVAPGRSCDDSGLLLGGMYLSYGHHLEARRSSNGCWPTMSIPRSVTGPGSSSPKSGASAATSTNRSRRSTE